MSYLNYIITNDNIDLYTVYSIISCTNLQTCVQKDFRKTRKSQITFILSCLENSTVSQFEKKSVTQFEFLLFKN